ncbi:putative retinol dehydrogenase 12 [Rosellinia necatrix]|uniref:Putative retinol dehydrogenase 12 n=1 Tax=Rosellinia necatrix TaxID=77044 RepID=A0A1W2TJQ2_ROSNE|nr:putative retinol dehydrogenase 12 [Rosellinia necatrix]
MSLRLESKAAFEGTTLGFLCRQFTRHKPTPATIQLTDQVAIVTGSNVGLGLEACRQLLELGLSHLIMAVRSQARGDAAALKLLREFPDAKILVWTIDMESYGSIVAFSDRCRTLPRLDIAILNAGIMKSPFTIVPATEHETMLQVNYLSTALLGILLLPILKARKGATGNTRPPVLTFVASDRAYQVDIETKGPVLQQLDRPEHFTQFEWYGKSKLLSTLFVSKLAELVDADDVLVNMANPGMTKGTEFFRGVPSFILPIISLGQFLLARSTEVAASIYVDAVAARGKESHGSFLSDWAIKPYPLICYKPEGRRVRDRLWEETMTELKFAGASSIIENLKSSAKK